MFNIIKLIKHAVCDRKANKKITGQKARNLIPLGLSFKFYFST